MKNYEYKPRGKFSLTLHKFLDIVERSRTIYRINKAIYQLFHK